MSFIEVTVLKILQRIIALTERKFQRKRLTNTLYLLYTVGVSQQNEYFSLPYEKTAFEKICFNWTAWKR